MGGESFVIKVAIRPELFDQMQDAPQDASIADTYKMIDGQFLSMIEDGDGEAGERYRALRAKEDGLGVRDLKDVLDWIVEEATGRPPTSQPDSPPTRAQTKARSTGGSSSRGLQAVGAD